jgi:hypothetical protein
MQPPSSAEPYLLTFEYSALIQRTDLVSVQMLIYHRSSNTTLHRGVFHST